MQGQETLAGQGDVVACAGSTAKDQTTFVVGAGSPARAKGWIAAKLVDAVQHAPEKEEPSESPSKRVKIHHCAEVKDWFLDLVAINFGCAAFGEQGAREVGFGSVSRQHVRRPSQCLSLLDFSKIVEMTSSH